MLLVNKFEMQVIKAFALIVAMLNPLIEKFNKMNLTRFKKFMPYLKTAGMLAFTAGLFLIVPDISFAESDANITKRINTGVKSIQTVLTGIVVVVGIVAALKIIIKHLPGIDDPHVKNEMWKSLGGVLLAVGAAAAVIWLLPWIYGLFK
ncbi:Cag pathogenicity island, type IV secretory system [Terribacillus saccharophilus]|uniref:Cag pathogenicity island, type IV secretory system n=1 Tax=Terribacillus saccharophilus TaxID=361277 RepID=A0AAX2EJR6_9BACI|nr:Cag pathogenicity island, type IV secretory system [Terribacillus saccharophilus]